MNITDKILSAIESGDLGACRIDEQTISLTIDGTPVHSLHVPDTDWPIVRILPENVLYVQSVSGPQNFLNCSSLDEAIVLRKAIESCLDTCTPEATVEQIKSVLLRYRSLRVTQSNCAAVAQIPRCNDVTIQRGSAIIEPHEAPMPGDKLSAKAWVKF